MKITNKGIEITEVAGVEHIEVIPADHEGGVDINIKLCGVASISFGVDELEELINALRSAHAEADRMRFAALDRLDQA